MSNKFQCHYNLKVNWTDENGKSRQEIVTDPVSIQFNITKTTQNDNSSRIIIYNLDSAVREEIYQDRLLLKKNDNVKWLTLEAGYGEKLTLVCLGYIQECSSVRSGVDVITTIDVIDPDILTEYTGVTFEAGTSFDTAYKYLIAQLPSLKIGETGGLSGVFKSPAVFDGNAFVLVNKLTGGHTFIDNGVINTLNDNEVLSDYGVYYIASDTGLLETPKRYGAILEIQMLFEPTIKIGQKVEIMSETWGSNLKKSTGFNGQYKVLGVSHNCTISNSDCGTRITTLQLQYLNYLTDSNVNLTNNPAGAPASVVKNNVVTPVSTKIDSEVESIYQQIKRFNGNVPRGLPITNRISWYEMIYASKKNIPSEVASSVTRGKLQACKTIAIRLTDFLNTYKETKGQEIKINSGYRTPQGNSRIEASALNSNHTKGMAIDFYLPNVSINTLRNIFQKNWKYGLGIYLKNNFIHVSSDINEKFIVRRKV